ncbi:MAG TPA: hypothetical protein EYG50_00650 [Cycloclasticus sp.]|jgi:D-glycerate 3-kinase|nr:hypothetical protein [Cycloclasticus sp.]HIL91252.1 hypothetical protein [Cycloclasticus sp.]
MQPLWPKDDLSLTRKSIDKLHETLSTSFQQRLQALGIDNGLLPYLKSFYIPFAAWINEKKSQSQHTLVLGINGAQGSGKSTLSQLVADVLEQGFGLTTAILSIDDIYKTRQQRQQMSVDLHPLFKTRGVPGTHNTSLGIELIKQTIALKKGEQLLYPVFDKGNDEPLPKSNWKTCNGPVDILIFEGWCVGAQAQTKNALIQDVNSLEQHEDPHGIWRHLVNEHLKSDYKTLFDMLDCLIFLQIPNVDCVLKWRGLQEQKLANKHQHEQHLMTAEKTLKRFIAHYERLTRFQLDDLPTCADITIQLGEDHQMKQLSIRRP